MKLVSKKQLRFRCAGLSQQIGQARESRHGSGIGSEFVEQTNKLERQPSQAPWASWEDVFDLKTIARQNASRLGRESMMPTSRLSQHAPICRDFRGITLQATEEPSDNDEPGMPSIKAAKRGYSRKFKDVSGERQDLWQTCT